MTAPWTRKTESRRVTEGALCEALDEGAAACLCWNAQVCVATLLVVGWERLGYRDHLFC